MDDTIKQHEQVVVVGAEEESSSDKKERIVNEFIQLFASEMYGSEILTKIILEQDLIKFSEWHQHESFSPKEWKEFISPIATSNVYSTIIYHLIEFCGMKAKIKDSTKLTKMIYRLIENSSSLLPLFSTILSYDKKKMIELCEKVLYLYDREYGLIPFDDK